MLDIPEQPLDAQTKSSFRTAAWLRGAAATGTGKVPKHRYSAFTPSRPLGYR